MERGKKLQSDLTEMCISNALPVKKKINSELEKIDLIKILYEGKAFMDILNLVDIKIYIKNKLYFIFIEN